MRHSLRLRHVGDAPCKTSENSLVKRASLGNNPYHAPAEKYLPKGQGGMLSFGIDGSVEKCAAFMEALKLIAQETHVADVRSCVLHPRVCHPQPAFRRRYGASGRTAEPHSSVRRHRECRRHHRRSGTGVGESIKIFYDQSGGCVACQSSLIRTFPLMRF